MLILANFNGSYGFKISAMKIWDDDGEPLLES